MSWKIWRRWDWWWTLERIWMIYRCQSGTAWWYFGSYEIRVEKKGTPRV